MATPVIIPKLEMTQETATFVEWLKQEGDTVEKGEPLFVIETDKITIEVEAPASGLLAGVRAMPQQVAKVTEVIAYILQPGEPLPEGGTQPVAAPPAQVVGPPGRPVAETLPGAPAPPGKVRATPVARRMARERGVDIAAVRGSGLRGRVQAADVAAFQPAPAVAPPPAGRVVPLRGMRRTIAERMTASYQEAPHTTFTVRVNVRAFEEARARLNSKGEVSGQPRVSVTALLVQVLAWALARHPWLNSTLRGEEIHLLAEVNVGVAVAVEEGLFVPVVRQADHKGVAQIAAEVNDLTVRAREGRLTPADVSEGTFTLSNLGPFGIEQFTAIINPPQAAILAVGAAQLEFLPDAEGRPVAQPVMRMTLSADHRIVDGAAAARFMAELREALEAPALLLW